MGLQASQRLFCQLQDWLLAFFIKVQVTYNHSVFAALFVTVHTAWWLGPDQFGSCPHGLQAKQTKLPPEASEGALTQHQSELIANKRAYQRSQAQLAQADALAEKAVWVITRE